MLGSMLSVRMLKLLSGVASRTRPAGLALFRIQIALPPTASWPPAVGQPAGKRVLLRQFQNGVTGNAADVTLWRDEIGRAGGVEDVLVGGIHALGIIAVEQTVRRLAGQHQSQFPREVFGVLHAGVGTACAER